LRSERAPINGSTLRAALCRSALVPQWTSLRQERFMDYHWQHFITALAVVSVLQFLLRSRRLEAVREGSDLALCYGRGMRAFVIGAVMFLVALTVFCIVVTAKPEEQWIKLCLPIGFALLVLPLVIELRVRYRFNQAQIVRDSPWTGPLSYRWEEVRSVRWSPSMQWFVISGKLGNMRISQFLSGLSVFAETVLARCTQAIADDQTRSLLTELAAVQADR
jgi:hypothetical protein